MDSGSKLSLALFFGGRSSEHEVSVVSAKNIAKGLDPTKYDVHYVAITKTGEWYQVSSIEDLPKSLTRESLPKTATAVSLAYFEDRPQLVHVKSDKREIIDVAFPALHGSFGEDGTIQGLFRMMNLPFVGCDVLGSSLSMDKDLMKRILIQAGIPTARYQLFRKGGQTLSFEELKAELGTPLFLKPANAGSSVGVHKIRSQVELDAGLKDAFMYDSKVIIEEAIVGQELEVAVLGHRDSAEASLAGEVIPNADFYSYHAKYVDPNGAAFNIPANLTQDETQQIQSLALRCFQLVDCEGLARVDFFYNKEKGFYVNELNTLPGFTSISIYPKLWTLEKFTYSSLMDELIRLAFAYYKERSELQTNFENLNV